MKVIDLTQQIYDGMPVYPGDPEVHILPVFTVENDEWAVSKIEMVTHDGTHVNVPRHIAIEGKSLSEYGLESFIAESRMYRNMGDIESSKGILFVDVEIDMVMAKVIAEKKPAFVGLSEKFDFNLEAERYLLEKGIISFEKLAHCELLPTNKAFMFYGIPLNIKEGDGSPVRAFAVLK